jgi:hypothetical protein
MKILLFIEDKVRFALRYFITFLCSFFLNFIPFFFALTQKRNKKSQGFRKMAKNYCVWLKGKELARNV